MQARGIGLYLHVPVCARKCAYCDFVSFARPELLPAVVRGLEEEMALQAALWGRLPVRTVFLGGGTPSLLSTDELARLLDAARSSFDMDAGAEISLEANPGTVDAAKLKAFRMAGVNRLSLGCQAAQDDLLATLGRLHRWPDVVQAAKWARDAGFDNISLDLMYGLPGQTAEDWAQSLDFALALGPNHLSCYELTLEPGTPLAMNRPVLPSEDAVLTMDALTSKKLSGAGLARYEISNYAAPGYECRHNLIYWRREPYLGLGPAAHSFLHGTRFSNVSEPELWLEGVGAGRPALAECALVAPEEARFESMMLGLRLVEGVALDAFFRVHGVSPFDCWGAALDTMREQGLLAWDEGRLWLTKQGLALQNTVLTALL